MNHDRWTIPLYIRCNSNESPSITPDKTFIEVTPNESSDMATAKKEEGSETVSKIRQPSAKYLLIWLLLLVFSAPKIVVSFTSLENDISQTIGVGVIEFQPTSNIINGTEPRIAFMHVGKTGGLTLRTKVLYFGCELIKMKDKKKACLEEMNESGVEESNLSKYTRGIYHFQARFGEQRYKIQGGATDVLFSIREPVARAISWYGYHSPNSYNEVALRSRYIAKKDPNSFEGRFFYDCFRSEAEMTQALVPGYTYNTTRTKNVTDCQFLLRDVFEDISRKYGHLSAGYRYYLRKAQLRRKERKYRKRRVLSIRTEFLWKDIETIDILLGGSGDFGNLEGKSVTHGSEKRAKAEISEESTIYLCCALLPEFAAYREIVERSANLDAQEKLETYRLSWRRCNVTGWDDLEGRCDSLDTLVFPGSSKHYFSNASEGPF